MDRIPSRRKNLLSLNADKNCVVFLLAERVSIFLIEEQFQLVSQDRSSFHDIPFLRIRSVDNAPKTKTIRQRYAHQLEVLFLGNEHKNGEANLQVL